MRNEGGLWRRLVSMGLRAVLTVAAIAVGVPNTSWAGGDRMADKVSKTEDEWRHCLSPEAYRVMREQWTEPPFSGKYYRNNETGVYHCAACGNPLFGSDTKFDSGTGWPSFFKPVSPGAVETRTDYSEGMVRAEAVCARCGSHLGHVFDDGPKPTGLRYCMNSVALDFKPADEPDSTTTRSNPTQQSRAAATFAAGCFWGVEAEFRKLKGVLNVTVGYTGGHTKAPTYKDVCSDRTGHAEAALVEYDPSQISYESLLSVFWDMHDPTTPNRQGPDVGSQYRSAIFYHDGSQRKAALASKQALEKSGRFKSKAVVTEIVPAAEFYRAEEYHQRYFEKHGIAGCHR